MTFEELLEQATALLQRRGRVTYRTLKLQFDLDDDHLEALKDELLYSQSQVRDEDGRGLVWTGATGSTATSPPAATSAVHQDRAPLTYTPPHLAEPCRENPHFPERARRGTQTGHRAFLRHYELHTPS